MNRLATLTPLNLLGRALETPDAFKSFEVPGVLDVEGEEVVEERVDLEGTEFDLPFAEVDTERLVVRCWSVLSSAVLRRIASEMRTMITTIATNIRLMFFERLFERL
jgi:hypothetical protein